MKTDTPGRLRMTLFSSFAPSGPPSGSWNHPNARAFDYLNLEDWIRLAKAMEEAKFDGFFWADHSGVHDIYQNSHESTVRGAIQFPLGDPLLLTAALASSTRDLGFAFSANVIQDHPYAFARRLSTLDHLTRGRIAWNVVTSFQPSAWRNLGHTEMGSHDARYEQAEEYLQVLYKLLLGSWEDDAVLRDYENKVYADPSKVHPIEHKGHYYSVPGIHTNEPSPQRLPVLFQAGTSSAGRAFSARNAEAVFIADIKPEAARDTIDDIRARLVQNGRRPSDALVFVSQYAIVGSTEAEARRKSAEAEEQRGEEFTVTYASSMMGIDFSTIDLDVPIGDFKSNALQGGPLALAKATPNKNMTFRDLTNAMLGTRTVGTPEQIADEFERLRDAGVDGINLTTLAAQEDVYEFIEHVVPVLQERGLMQREYVEGTLREKLFAGTESASGPRINDRHSAAAYRAQQQPVT